MQLLNIYCMEVPNIKSPHNTSQSLSPNGVVILGMHRSRTSVLLDGIMNLTGCSLGSGKLIGPRDSNPKGYFESSAMVRQNDEWNREQEIRWSFGRGEFDAANAKLGDHDGREALKNIDLKVSLAYKRILGYE
jgi:hypothetical protein